MLCGEFCRTSPLGFSDTTRSPYCTLLALSQGMANISPEDDDIYLENGLLSYENPNYHLDPARLDDALNSNVEEDLYKEILTELKLGLRNGLGSEEFLNELRNTEEFNMGLRQGPGGGEARKTYAALDITQMGVDVHVGPVTTLHDNRSLETGEVSPLDNSTHLNNLNMGRRNRTKPDLIEEAENRCNEQMKETSPNKLVIDGIPHIEGDLNQDLYAVPVKNVPSPLADTPDKDSLPPGWEKHEDNDGPYYWHIKSGTIQREPPSHSGDFIEPSGPPVVPLPAGPPTVPRSTTSSALEALQRKDELALKRRSYPIKMEQEVSKDRERAIRFAVRSLGWLEIAEEDLTPERSSKAVNKCIVDLSLGRNDLLDVVGRWGDGKDLFMDLDEGALKLVDPEKLTVLNTQPIHAIRVWGVGRDNGRDFAYVARDRTSRRHMCHVFRCDIPARTIANTLRDICKKIMIERSVHQNLAKPVDLGGSSRSACPVRPTNLPIEHRRQHRSGPSVPAQSFPTPMEEPKKVLRAQYMGSCEVSRASGMDVLNEAIQRLSANPSDTWQSVSIAVAPSMISIAHSNDESQILCECRVRYLSFLGIGENMKQCGFIMHTAQDIFIAHVFHCEPSSGALCKTIEAACKLRYQKCLDAHPQGSRATANGSQTPGKGLGATIKSLVGSLTGRKAKSTDS